MGISALNPALLWGLAGVGSPILIHLLSKRRFRVVDWAAMEFLLAADRRNRRRIRLENLLLLLLRCLAVALLALLVSRLFLRPQGLGALALRTVHYERFYVVDDSLSMAAQVGGESVFDRTKRALVQTLRELALDRPGDTLTLVTTSQPDRKVIAGRDLNASGVEALVREVEALTVSDLPANYDRALTALDAALGEGGGHPNRLVCLVTDLRRRDWEARREAGATPGELPGAPAERDAGAGTDKPGPSKFSPVVERIKALAQKTERFTVLDVGEEVGVNVAVSSVLPREKSLVAGVISTFDVTVMNAGTTDAQGVEVSFAPEGAAPQRAELRELRVGESATLPFTFRFSEAGSGAVKAEVGADALPGDNARHFAARVGDGAQVLVVDGDPSSDPDEAESLFIARALSPPRFSESDALSGYAVKVLAEDQFEAATLEGVQLVVLCNLYRLSEERAAALRKWVTAGGGLVIFLGDQVDDQNYIARHEQGAGLIPAKLTQTMGDESRSRWATIEVEDANHPVFGAFTDPSLRPLLQEAKVFRWWHAQVDEAALKSGAVRVPARLSGPEGSPAVVERSLGQGRVVMVTTACDTDWGNWPSSPSYTVVMQELAAYAAARATQEGTLPVGSTLRLALDPAKHEMSALVLSPADSQGVPAERVEEDQKLYLTHADTRQRGLYTLRMTRRDGQREDVLFAVNADPAEGRMARVDSEGLRQALGGGRVELVRAGASLGADTAGARAELWRPLLWALMAVLVIEQALAWAFGTHRR